MLWWDRTAALHLWGKWGLTQCIKDEKILLPHQNSAEEMWHVTQVPWKRAWLWEKWNFVFCFELDISIEKFDDNNGRKRGMKGYLLSSQDHGHMRQWPYNSPVELPQQHTDDSIQMPLQSDFKRFFSREHTWRTDTLFCSLCRGEVIQIQQSAVEMPKRETRKQISLL